MEKHKSQYIRVHDFMVTDLKLRGSKLLVYAYIHSYSQVGKECFTTQTRMAKWLNLDRSTICRALNELEASELIVRTEADEHIAYKTSSVANSNDFFNIFDYMPKRTSSANELLVLAYIHKNLKAIHKDIAAALHISAQTVTRIISCLEQKGALIREIIRDAYGHIKGKLCRLSGFKKCNTGISKCNTELSECYTNNKTDTKKYNKSKNLFNNILKSDTYIDKSESELELLLGIL